MCMHVHSVCLCIDSACECAAGCSRHLVFHAGTLHACVRFVCIAPNHLGVRRRQAGAFCEPVRGICCLELRQPREGGSDATGHAMLSPGLTRGGDE